MRVEVDRAVGAGVAEQVQATTSTRLQVQTTTASSIPSRAQSWRLASSTRSSESAMRSRTSTEAVRWLSPTTTISCDIIPAFRRDGRESPD
jgi:hypothetical protein